jgi:hypothetical protein
MNENETMNEDISNEEEEVVVEDATEETFDESQEDETEETNDRDEELEKLRKENKTLKIQKGKKAEKDAKTAQAPQFAENMSSMDMFAFMNAKVTNPKDIAEVTEWAKHKKISVEEALESSIMQTVLAGNKDSRKVSSATNTGSSRRGTSEVSGDDLLANAGRDKMPDSDADLDRMLEAKYSGTRRK